MTSSGSGRVVNQTEIANVFGVTAATIRAWVTRGCPVVDRGGKGKTAKYNTAAVSRWREDQVALAAAGDNASVDFDEAKRRHMVAQAILAEVEADLKTGAVVLIEDVVKAVTDEYALVRNRILNISSKVAPRAAALRSAVEVKTLIDLEVGHALEELSADNKWGERSRFQINP